MKEKNYTFNRFVKTIYNYGTVFQIKQGNRQCETLLHDIEIASSLALCQDRTFQYPMEKLRELWRSRYTY